MTTGGGFSLNSGFTKILCTPEKPLRGDTFDLRPSATTKEKDWSKMVSKVFFLDRMAFSMDIMVMLIQIHILFLMQHHREKIFVSDHTRIWVIPKIKPTFFFERYQNKYSTQEVCWSIKTKSKSYVGKSWIHTISCVQVCTKRLLTCFEPHKNYWSQMIFIKLK